jgi:enoyl-CoA hydratase/carnithine racemase
VEEPRVSDAVLREPQGRILVITINRPEARNAVNLAVSQGLADAVAFAEKHAPNWTGT